MIKEFQGEYRWLSNFWPCNLNIDGKDWPSVEHYYQAMKTENVSIQERIRRALKQLVKQSARVKG